MPFTPRLHTLAALAALTLAALCPVRAAPAPAVAFEDFEGGLDAWSPGLQRVGRLVKQGEFAGLWADPGKDTTVRRQVAARDWSPYAFLEFWCHSKAATGARILLLAASENPETEGPDYYFLPLTVDWQEWRRLRVPLRAFRAARRPLGWNRIASLSFCASGYPDCLPKEGTQLTFDDLRLAKAAPGEAGVVADFECDLGAWEGLQRDATLRHGGDASGRWQDLAHTPYALCRAIPSDWSAYDALEAWVHSAAANGQEMKLLLGSENPDSPGQDGFITSFRVDWEGWKCLRFSRHRDFEVLRSPLGWDRVGHLLLAGGNYGIQARPDTLLHLDDLRLVRDAPAPALVVSDMEEARWPWSGLARDPEEPRAGKACGRWSDMEREKTISLKHLPRDWTGFEALSFWCRVQAAAPIQVKLLLYSDTPETPDQDYFLLPLRLEPGGWREVRIPLRFFGRMRQPVGWHATTCLMIAGDGFGLTANPNAVVWLDDVALVRRPTTASASPAPAAPAPAAPGVVEVR